MTTLELRAALEEAGIPTQEDGRVLPAGEMLRRLIAARNDAEGTLTRIQQAIGHRLLSPSDPETEAALKAASTSLFEWVNAEEQQDPPDALTMVMGLLFNERPPWKERQTLSVMRTILDGSGVPSGDGGFPHSLENRVRRLVRERDQFRKELETASIREQEAIAVQIGRALRIFRVEEQLPVVPALAMRLARISGMKDDIVALEAIVEEARSKVGRMEQALLAAEKKGRDQAVTEFITALDNECAPEIGELGVTTHVQRIPALLGRWQDAIYQFVRAGVPYPDRIDGGGSDGGALDLTLSEIAQGFAQLTDLHDEEMRSLDAELDACGAPTSEHGASLSRVARIAALRVAHQRDQEAWKERLDAAVTSEEDAQQELHAQRRAAEALDKSLHAALDLVGRLQVLLDVVQS